MLCHCFVTMELTEEIGRLEVLHLTGYWLAVCLPLNPYFIRATGGVDPLALFLVLSWTFPAYAIVDKIRKAVRAHQLRIGQLGPFVDDFVTHVFMFYSSRYSTSRWKR